MTRPTFLSAGPHFFKIVVQKTIQDKKLRIPKKFVKKYGPTISSSAFLNLPSGLEWPVKLETCGGEVWFKKGWPEFVDHLSIKHGHVLVFRYDGNSHFHVIILDTSTTEIDYPISSPFHFDYEDHQKKPKKEDVEGSDDDSVQILDDKDFSSPLPKTVPKSGSQSSCPRPQKRMRSTTTITLSSSSCGGSWEPKPKVVNRRKQRLSPKEEATALKRAQCFASENPFFSIVMTPSHVFCCHNNVTIPKKFAERYMNENQSDLTLRVSDGRSWIVQYNRRTLLRGLASSGTVHHEIHFRGWKEFARDNNLQLGDVCIFELMNKANPGIVSTSFLFQVSINRHNTDDASSSPSHSLGCSSGHKNNSTSVKKSPSGCSGEDGDPWFQALVRMCHVQHSTMTIPIEFVRTSFKKKGTNQNAKLKVQNRSWDVKVICRPSPNNRYMFAAGWGAFARDNSLRPGDNCRFQMVDKDPIVFQVSIKRVTSAVGD